MFLVPLLSGCGDACQRACQSARLAVADCLDDWNLDWEDLSARSGADFRQDCEDDWEVLTPTLETRELEQALDACQRVVDQADELSCDELRAVYVE
ncbi:MAG: hypothetical protein H6740_29045 [Alphaproteobacteria bacterium]|nr:hypothetical protein [Alphaproteobacteria bacterium]